MSKAWWEKAASVTGLALLGASGWFLHRELRLLELGDVSTYLFRTPVSHLVLALALSAVGYIVILGYDVLGVRFVGVPLGLRRTLLASFIGNAFSNSVSLPVLGVGGVRFRFYAAWGFTPEQFARMVGFVGLGSWLGLLTVSGATFVLEPPRIPFASPISLLVLRILGLLFLAFVAGYLALCASKCSIHLWRWTLPIPAFRVAVAQTAVGVGDWLAQATLVYVLMPPEAGVSLPWFISAYSAAMMVTMIGHVPAGIGVFDSGVLLLMTPVVSHERLLGVLILYRMIYHLLPLLLAALMLGGFEVRERLFHREDRGR